MGQRVSIFLVAISAMLAAQAPAPQPVTPLVSIWYRGTPAGNPRADDLSVIRALGFGGVTWPADQTKGLVRSRIGAPTPSLDATVGYQITVDVSEAGKRIRVTPEWHMNISSESSKTQLIPIGIDERPQLYIEFFEELDKYFKK